MLTYSVNMEHMKNAIAYETVFLAKQYPSCLEARVCGYPGLSELSGCC